jgi:hypothetical protein
MYRLRRALVLEKIPARQSALQLQLRSFQVGGGTYHNRRSALLDHWHSAFLTHEGRLHQRSGGLDAVADLPVRLGQVCNTSAASQHQRRTRTHPKYERNKRNRTLIPEERLDCDRVVGKEPLEDTQWQEGVLTATLKNAAAAIADTI